jgi:FtsZ-interacting cell division protein YlmF
MAKKGFFEKLMNFVGIEQEVVEEDREEDGPQGRSDGYRQGVRPATGLAVGGPSSSRGPGSQERATPATGGRGRPQLVRMDQPAAGPQRQLKVLVVEPRSFDEVQPVADALKTGRAIIINLEFAERENARRLLDFLSGSLYVLGGSLQRVGGNIFMLAPSGVEIDVDIRSEVAATADAFRSKDREPGLRDREPGLRD